MSHVISLYEAWELIPRFNGRNVSHVDDFINSAMYASGRVDPSQRPDLLREVLAGKIRGFAAASLAGKDITTFEQLKEELTTLYRSRRSIATIKSEWKNCRQKGGESVGEYSQRFTRLMKELIAAFVNSTRSARVQINIPRYVRGVALNLYVAGLRPRYKKTQERGYSDLPEAIVRALGEERVEKNPHMARITCNWCGDLGHLSNNCFLRIRNERRLGARGLIRRRL